MNVNFRNLGGRPLERWVALLAAERYSAGARLLIRAGSEERVRALDAALWTFDPASFVPHGTGATGRAEQQPIYLTHGEEVPNQPVVLIVVDNALPSDAFRRFETIDFVFERADADAREAARLHWRTVKEAGSEPIYWQADANGWQRAG